MLKSSLPCIAALLIHTSAGAEPIGKWWAGYGQGAMEYGIRNDSGHSDVFYIYCPSGGGATINVNVGGIDPKPGSTVVVTIGGDEFGLYTNRDGEFDTESHVHDDTFRSLWSGLRNGSVMRVRLSTGQSTVFTLKGSSKALPAKPCQTGYEL